MDEKKKRTKRAPRQDWHPNAFVRVLHILWKTLVSVLKIAAGAVATVALIVIVCGFVFVNFLGEYLEEDIMSIAAVDLEELELDKTSFIYYVDDQGEIQILQQIYSTTDRQWIYYEDIPEELIHACVAIEDKRFFEHQGVDWITTVKACLSMFFGGSEFGGSTITQQFIKNYYGDDSVTVQRKVMEIFRAIAMEKTYDKEVIIEWYMNTVYFGEGCYGVKSAAANYFGKEVQDMNVAELASLIGITNNPSLFRPFRTTLDYGGLNGEERNRVRQLNILSEMLAQGWLTEEEYAEAISYEMVFKKGVDSEDRWAKCENTVCGYQGAVRTLRSELSEVGTTLYYCPECGQSITVTTDASQSVYSWYVDEVIDQVARTLAEEEGVFDYDTNEVTRANFRDKLGRGGYHIYTPYDANVQNAVDSVYTDLSKIPTVMSGQQLQSAIVIVDNTTGDIVAMAGGVGEKTDFDAYNRATDAPLQIGSAIKPLTIYARGFDLGAITPATVIDDLPLMYNNGDPWPRNDNRQYNYSRTIWRGIVSSVNAVAVNTLDMLGVQASYDFAKYEFGLSTLTDHYETSSGAILTDVGYAALGLGALTDGVTVRDVTCAYATFANNGVYREGRVWTKVYDSYGNVVLKNDQDTRKILGEKAINYINYCLDSGVASGTGTSADLYAELGMDVAGKTGSTSSNKDRYFAGFTGHYTAAVWCGFDIPEEIILTNVWTNPSCRLWKAVMLQIHQNLETVPLYDDSEMVKVTVCLESGKLATEACNCDIRGISRTETVMVFKEDMPKEFCDKHVMMRCCTVGGCVANEWCEKYAEVGALLITEKSLVYMTDAKYYQLLTASGKGLTSNYVRNEYVYLLDSKGNPVDYYGFTGTINRGLHMPYQVCTEHTRASWERFLEENPWIENGDGLKPVEPAPSEPTKPTEPAEPTEPGEGNTEENEQQGATDWLRNWLDSLRNK